MIPGKISVKNYSDTYIYNKFGDGKYEKATFEFIMSSTQVDKNSESFKDIVYDVKRRQTPVNIVTVLMSHKTVLLMNSKPLPRSFKVFYCRDVRSYSRDTKNKVFIDVSDIMYINNEGKLVCKSIDILIAYLISAMGTMIYYEAFNTLSGNTSLIETSTSCFVDLFCYVLDYLRVSGYSTKKNGCAFYAALYFQYSLLGKDMYSNISRRIAQSIANINNKDGDILLSIVDEKDMTDINTFVSFLSKYLKEEKLDSSTIINKWMYLIGTGTQFGLEMFPSFSTILTNAYSGVYLNNQKNIEKNAKDLIAFNNALFKMGSDLIR